MTALRKTKRRTRDRRKKIAELLRGLDMLPSHLQVREGWPEWRPAFDYLDSVSLAIEDQDMRMDVIATSQGELAKGIKDTLRRSRLLGRRLRAMSALVDR